MDLLGQKIIIVNIMRSKKDTNKKLQEAIKILKFILTLNDEEIIKSSIESVVENLEDLTNQ